MEVAKTPEELKARLGNIPQEKRGFVPTMGALHPGHTSLIYKALNDGNSVIASVFVNRLQFNNAEDFRNYPKTPEHDLRMLAEAGCELVFMPDEKDLFVPGLGLKKYELGFLENVMEGKFRPGHFQGVAQVVHRLLCLTEPSMAYFGEKDFQQCMVIQKLIELEMLPVKMIKCPVIRESDGLAMSSRNLRLSEDARKQAGQIYLSMRRCRDRFTSGDSVEMICEQETQKLQEQGLQVEYLEICHEKGLEPVNKREEKDKEIRVFVAAYASGIRLIDNLSLSDED
jgi:pantoate--beta-alanine ligase